MADPQTMTVRMRAEYHNGGGVKKPGEKVSLDYKQAQEYLRIGMAVDPDAPEAEVAGSDEARTAELTGEVTLLRGEIEVLGTSAEADAKLIADLRAQVAKAEGEIAKLKTA